MNARKKNCLEILLKLEKDDNIINRFSVFNSTSWVCIKNIVYERSLDNISYASVSKQGFISIKFIWLVFVSLLSYVRKVINHKPQNFYIGAASGIFNYKGEYIDTYLPYEISKNPGVPKNDILYWITATHLDQMWLQRKYIEENSAIVSSFVVTPFRLFLTKIIKIFLLANSTIKEAAVDVSENLMLEGINVPQKDIVEMHSRFCAGYIIYRILLFPFKIKRAYIVSAYSNSEICAVLIKMGAEIIEIQHGIIGPVHRGYNYAVKSTLLPTPNVVSVYNDFWKNELIEAGYFALNQVVVNRRLKYNLAEKEIQIFIFPYIVFTGQGMYPKDISEFINNLMLINSSINLVYVPHPNEDIKYISIMERTTKNSRVHYALNNIISTEKLIKDCVAHISINSSCHFDAIHYVGRTFVLNLIEGNVMFDYVERYPKSFILISSANEFAEYI